MPELTDRQVDEHLADLERDLGPTLRAAYRGTPMRGTFASELRTQLNARATRPPFLRALPQRVWAGVAALLVGSVVVGAALFATRPQPVSAADVLDQLQAEAVSVSMAGPGPVRKTQWRWRRPRQRWCCVWWTKVQASEREQ